MLRQSASVLRRAARGPSPLTQAVAHIGSKAPGEDWGQPASGGTTFLGTPSNYKQLLAKRPLSPDVFGLDGASRHLLATPRRDTASRCCRAPPSPLPPGKPHYNFPPVALSSITTRITGVILSGGAHER